MSHRSLFLSPWRGYRSFLFRMHRQGDWGRIRCWAVGPVVFVTYRMGSPE